MNEQIRELWRESVLKHTNDPMNWQPVADEFAELIVRECEKVSLKNSHRDDDMGAIIARQIKQHFGVSE